MNSQASDELAWLTATVCLTGLLWIPYVINRFRELGPPTWAWFPQPDPPPRAPWAVRSMQAHANAVENLVLFAPLALAAHLVAAGGVVSFLCASYFVARLVHAGVTIAGLPIPLRTAAFLAGFACLASLAVVIFSAL